MTTETVKSTGVNLEWQWVLSDGFCALLTCDLGEVGALLLSFDSETRVFEFEDEVEQMGPWTILFDLAADDDDSEPRRITPESLDYSTLAEAKDAALQWVLDMIATSAESESYWWS